MTAPALRTARMDRLETLSLSVLLCFVAALQLSVAASGVLLALTLLCWGALLVLREEQLEVPAFLLAAGRLRRRHPGLHDRLGRPGRQPGRLQAAGPVPDRAAGLPAGARPSGAPVRVGHHRRRRRQRPGRAVPVRVPAFRQPRSSAARRAHALHDVLGRAHARGLRRPRRACCSAAAIASGHCWCCRPCSSRSA